MRLVVTGKRGQVARSLVERGAQRGVEVLPLGRPELDLSASERAIVAAVVAARAEVLVSAAAYTQVDRAETDPETAFVVNEHGPRALARAARELSIPLIHLSTDYVFDGMKLSPYAEEDPTRPLSVYGASKLAGERAVCAEHANTAVLRSAWVYSPFGINFLKTMLRLAGNRDEIRVVSDQLGNPTNALDLADGILTVATHLVAGNNPAHRGVFHITSRSEASWAEFAEAIFAASSSSGGPTARVIHVGAAEYLTAARRPANSRLDSSKLERAHGVRLPDWRPSLETVVSRLFQRSKMRNLG